MKTLRIIGIVAVICASFGLLFNLMALYTIFWGERPPSHEEEPYFWPAFYVMAFICLFCYLALAVFGVQFIRGRINWIAGFIYLLIFEVVYFFSIGLLWEVSGIGRGVAGATGLANGGLSIQFIILFPLWAGILAYKAKRKIEQST